MDIVIVAGVPSSLSSYFAAVMSKRLEQGVRRIVWSPVSDHAPYYSDGYVAKLHRAFKREIAATFPKNALVSGEFFQSRAILVYADYSDDRSGVAQLLRSFVPTVLAFSVPPTSVRGAARNPNSFYERVRNEFVASVEQAIRKSQKALSLVEKEITSRANKTCLLLPCTHFKSDNLKVFYNNLSSMLASKNVTPSDFNVEIRRAENENFNRERKGRISSFVDDRNLMFKGPGKDLHGYVRFDNDGAHRPECLTRSRFRFGVTFHPCFHYDCEPLKGGVARDWDGCHLQPFRLGASRDHVNISPNDSVR